MRTASVLVRPGPGWAAKLVPELVAGSHVVTVMDDFLCIEARHAGLELRDTLVILSQGPRCRYAFLWRVPFSRTVLEQIAATGTGGLNVGASRVKTSATDAETSMKHANTPNSGQFKAHEAGFSGAWSGSTAYDMTAGRWPPNVLFIHGSGCRYEGTKQVRPGNGSGKAVRQRGIKDEGRNTFGQGMGWMPEGTPDLGYVGEDGLEVVPYWVCEPGCPVGLLDAQAGERPSTLTGRANPMVTHENPGDNGGASLFGGGNSRVYADSGGASRYYPQFANETELLDWLKQLIRTKAYDG